MCALCAARLETQTESRPTPPSRAAINEGGGLSPRASQRGDGVRVGGQAGRGRAVSGVEPSSLRDLDTDVGGTGYAYGFIHQFVSNAIYIACIKDQRMCACTTTLNATTTSLKSHGMLCYTHVHAHVHTQPSQYFSHLGPAMPPPLLTNM